MLQSITFLDLFPSSLDQCFSRQEAYLFSSEDLYFSREDEGVRKRAEEGQEQCLLEMGRQRKEQCQIKKERDREWLDIGLGAQEKRRQRWRGAKQRGGPQSEAGPKASRHLSVGL